MTQMAETTPYGQARIEPGDAVVVGSYTTWTLTYTVGELGMDDGGTLLIAFSQKSDMGDSQFEDPAVENYCRVQTEGDARLVAEYDPRAYVRPMKHAVRITVRDGSLAPGETVQLRLGETSGGVSESRPSRSPRPSLPFAC